MANIEAGDDYVLTSELNPRQFAEMTDLDFEVAQALYASYAVKQDQYGQIVTNLENYRIALIDLLDYLFDEREGITLNLDEETEDKLDDLEERIRDGQRQLRSDSWSRIVIDLNLPTEGEESYEYLEVIHGLTARYYTEYYLVGDTTSCSDLRSSFQKDNLLISVLTVVFVILVLLFSFKSVGLPLLLINFTSAGVMSIWLTAGITWMLAGISCFVRYISWRKKQAAFRAERGGEEPQPES